MLLVIAPAVALGAVLRGLGSHEYPAGDIRNEPLFWLAVVAGTIILAAVMLVSAVREIRRR
jgi:hypothetical protein